MISSVQIKNYKSINDITLDFSSLNLLSGPNSSGKSSSIQALLLAIDNIQQAESSRSLYSSRIYISSFNESRNYITNAKTYSVRIRLDDENAEISFLPKDDSYIGTTITQKGLLSDKNYSELKSAFYLSAMRTGDLGLPKINPNPDINPLGLNGEYIIDYFFTHSKDLVADNLISDPKSRTLEGQVNFWLQKLTGYTLSIQPLGAEYIVKYNSPEGKAIHPYNVGTGVNFIAETIIVCLASRTRGLVIIENPEIHLHPSAQADMLDFLVGMANAGIQVILESHSDHFFNGIRRSLSNGLIKTNDVSVYNFSKNNGLTQAEKVLLSATGGIENYIPGMFEQFDLDLDAILK